MDSQLEKRVDPAAVLSELELPHYEKFVASGKPRLSADLAGRLFELYLSGKNCGEIQQAYAQVSYGAILAARVDFQWDAERSRHIARLTESVSDRLMATQLEALVFVSEFFKVTHKVNMKKYEAYLIDGDENHLKGAMKIDNMKQYADLVRALGVLSGKPQQTGEFHHIHEAREPDTGDRSFPKGTKTITAEVIEKASGPSFLKRKAAEVSEAAQASSDAASATQKKLGGK